MYFRQLLNDDTACASYLLGCKTHSAFAVVDPHVDLVDEYVALAEAQGAAIVAVFETHVQADHVSGLPDARRAHRRDGLPARRAPASSSSITRWPTARSCASATPSCRRIATPGHARGAPRLRRHRPHVAASEPWFVLTGDALLVGDAGRPDLHAHGEQTVEAMARTLYRSLTERLLALPDHLSLYPAHYSGSVCGRGLSANPASTIGFERRHNRALQFDSEDAFVDALTSDIPPAPEHQAAIVAANRAGAPTAEVA